MFNIQGVCESISNKIAQDLSLDNNKKAIINYGLFAMIQTIIAIFVILIVGSIFNVVIPALILSFVGVILRKYSGGAHAKTPELCLIISTIISIGGAIIATRITWNLEYVLLVGVVIFVGAFYYIYKLAPVDSIAKPIKREEKRLLLKKKSIFILIMYGMITIAILVLYIISHKQLLLTYIVCMYVGIAWQVFTLTSIGHKIIRK